MIVTATEFKTNLGKYLELATAQDIFITKMEKTLPVSPILLWINWQC